MLSMDYGRDMFLFMGFAIIQIAASIIVLFSGRTWKRWLVVFIAIPCAVELVDRAILLLQIMKSA
jgi:hypothetical protein